jgi:putative transposase
MLNDPEFQDYCRRLQLSETAVVYIRRVRSSGPSRRVRCGRDNVSHLCDIELVCSETDTPLGRPWLTLLLDGFSRRVLSFALDFDKPSYRSTMLIMRESVRRHGRLPSTLVVDGGPEFRHIAFDALCHRYGCTVQYRSSARPQFGSIIERIFGTIGTQFFQNLAGSTRAPRDWSKPSMTVQARKEAVWTLEAVHSLLEEFLYDLYEDRVHPGLNTTPRLAYDQGMEQAGTRQARSIPYDSSFTMLTLSTTTKGTATVQPCGVKLHGTYYWCDAFRSGAWFKKALLVRYDPWNLAVAWVYLEGTWQRCISTYAEAFEGRTERELMLEVDPRSRTTERGN